MDLKQPTPKSLGYRMPAEWEPQNAIWLSWPHNLETFAEFLHDVRVSYSKYAAVISKDQKVKMLINTDHIEDAKKYLNENSANMENVEFYELKPEDVWVRDYGPTFVINKDAKEPLAMVKWRFNAWGDKYDDLMEDNRIPYEINSIMKLPMFEPGIVLEGGSIDVNGAGVVLTSEQCLLNPNRNPQLNTSDIETYLKEYLNVEKVIWLKEGVAGDDTDGHIDDIARFVDPNTIVYTYEDNEQDPNHPILKENLEILQQATDIDGNPFKLVKIPMPDPIIDGEKYLPASYINYYIANSVVVVPTFGCPKDEEVLSIFKNLFPTRQVVGVNCKELVYGLGTLHCSSQQEPKP